MKVISCLKGHTPSLKGAALCLGAFDGVHRGHLSLLKRAKALGKKVVVLLFSEPPSHFFYRDKSSFEITPLRAKLRRLEEINIVDMAVILKATPQLFALSYLDFINQVLKEMNPDILVCGEDYRFGAKALGTPTLLKEFFYVEEVPLLSNDEGKISSQRIIRAIEEGDMEKANADLGYPYAIEGEVREGFHNGHKIGFPTANLTIIGNYVLPKRGVYIGKAKFDKEEKKAIINVGNNPTVGLLKETRIECHLLDFNGDLYSKTIIVSFLRFLREEKKFASLEELALQLEKDKESA